MKAADIMTWPVISIEPDTPVQEAIVLMLKHRISALPVVDAGGALVGIVSEGDLLRRIELGTERHRPRWLEFLLGPGRLAAEYAHSHGRTVKEVMTTELETVGDGATLDEIVALMERRHIKRVPVMRNGKLAGIVSRANLMQALASLAPAAPEHSQSDAALREKLMAEMDQQPWAPKGLINIIVKDGVASLWGSITDEREREALHVLAENTPGINGVQDHLVWVEPTSGLVISTGDDPLQPKAS
jgi:CBS domain-containing protein